MMTPTDLNSAASSFTAGSTEHHLSAMDKLRVSLIFSPKNECQCQQQKPPSVVSGEQVFCASSEITHKSQMREVGKQGLNHEDAISV